ncbi:helix-turn-helix domain-containing protein [Streptomyces sp. L7]
MAGRVFSVLDAFVGGPDTLRLTDIARRAGLPVPTALRMVRELVSVGRPGARGRRLLPASAPASGRSARRRPAPWAAGRGTARAPRAVRAHRRARGRGRSGGRYGAVPGQRRTAAAVRDGGRQGPAGPRPRPRPHGHGPPASVERHTRTR